MAKLQRLRDWARAVYGPGVYYYEPGTASIVKCVHGRCVSVGVLPDDLAVVVIAREQWIGDPAIVAAVQAAVQTIREATGEDVC